MRLGLTKKVVKGLILTIAFGMIASDEAYSQESSSDYNGFELATGEGTIGEIGSLNLKPASFNLHLLNNDYLGKTDKYLTGSNSAGLLLGWKDGTENFKSLAINVYWRAIVPAVRSKDGEPAYDQPRGVFADWLDSQISYSVTKPTMLGGLKLQLGYSYGDIRNHGIKNVHKEIHQVARQPTSDLSYENQPVGSTNGCHIIFSHIVPAISLYALKLNWQTSIGGQTSKVMDEYFIRGNAILSITNNFKLGFERKLVKQVDSELYDNIRHNRYESTFSMLIGEIFQPSIKYVSPYLKDDNVGQVYLDFLNLTVPL